MGGRSGCEMNSPREVVGSEVLSPRVDVVLTKECLVFFYGDTLDNPLDSPFHLTHNEVIALIPFLDKFKGEVK